MAEEKEPPFPSPEDYGRSLKGIGVNLLVRDVEKRLPQGQQRLERIAADERQQRIYFIK